MPAVFTTLGSAAHYIAVATLALLIVVLSQLIGFHADVPALIGLFLRSASFVVVWLVFQVAPADLIIWVWSNRLGLTLPPEFRPLEC